MGRLLTGLERVPSHGDLFPTFMGEEQSVCVCVSPFVF